MTAQRAEIGPGRGTGPTVWGLDARAMHDHFWAAHGVEVVRRGAGGGPRPPRSPRGTCLLLEADDLVLFDPRLAAKRPPRTAALCLEVLESDPDHYSERVVADDSNRLLTIERRYTAPTRAALKVLITADASLASSWHGSATRNAADRHIRLAAGLARYRTSQVRGRSFDARDPEQARDFMLTLMQQWHHKGPGWPHVGVRRPGVWVHDTATVEPGVRFAAPVWVGAHVTLRRGDVVVGPAVIDDRVAVSAPQRAVTRPVSPTPFGVPDAAPISRRRRLGKRVFDIAFSFTVLAITGPLFPLIMLAIWLEDGRPFFFVHTRQTLGGRNFACYKFRTMYRNAEALKGQLKPYNVCDGPQFHIEDDPRLLRVGKIMRRYHLDELPQFVNVLLGHMGVIGPRPSPDNENQYCPAWRDARLSVKPGVTGLWQVGRTRAPNTDFQEWIRHDLDYVERQNWGLDLLIIYKTIEGIVGRGRRGEPNGRPGREEAATEQDRTKAAA